MKILTLVGTLVLATSVVGCATTGGDDGKIILGKLPITKQQNVAEKEKPKSGEEFNRTGKINLSKQIPMYVDFIGSPKMSAALNQRMKEAGYQISESGQRLAIAGVYEARGQFVDKGFINTGRLNIADLMEKSLVDVVDKQRNAPKAGYAGTDIATANSMADLSGGMVSGLVNYMAIDALMTALGVKDAINHSVSKALGTDKDPYKFCAFGCEADKAAWNQTTQTVSYLVGFAGEKMETKLTAYTPTFNAEKVITKALDQTLQF